MKFEKHSIEKRCKRVEKFYHTPRNEVAKGIMFLTGLSVIPSVRPSSISCEVQLLRNRLTDFIHIWLDGSGWHADVHNQMPFPSSPSSLNSCPPSQILWELLDFEHFPAMCIQHILVNTTPLKLLNGFHSYLAGWFVVPCRCAYLIAILIWQIVLELLDFNFLCPIWGRVGYVSVLTKVLSFLKWR